MFARFESGTFDSDFGRRALSLGLACLAVAQTPAPVMVPSPATTSLAPATTPAYSAAHARQTPASAAAAPGTSAAAVPLLDPSRPTWHQTTATDPAPAATPIPSATRFSRPRSRRPSRGHAVHACFEHAHIDCESHQRQRHLAQRSWPGLARIRHQPLHAARDQHESAGTGDRRLDPARDRLRSLALRAAGDSQRRPSHAPRLPHARNASGRGPNGRPVRQQRGGDPGFRPAGRRHRQPELAGQGPADPASRAGPIAGDSSLAAGQGRRVACCWPISASGAISANTTRRICSCTNGQASVVSTMHPHNYTGGVTLHPEQAASRIRAAGFAIRRRFFAGIRSAAVAGRQIDRRDDQVPYRPVRTARAGDGRRSDAARPAAAYRDRGAAMVELPRA